MNLEWIEKEEEKWIKESENFWNWYCTHGKSQPYDSDIAKEFCKFTSQISVEMFKYYMDLFPDDTDRKDILRSFMNKKIISEENEIIPVQFAYNKAPANAGYSNGIIHLNPFSALLLYNCYRQFLNGELDNIRLDIDYEKIKITDYKTLENLSYRESLYYCYVHKITFEEFSKMTIIHECSHHFGLSDDVPLGTDSLIVMSLTEGITEFNARRFAESVKRAYLPIYRNKDYMIIKKIIEKYSEKENISIEQATLDIIFCSLYDINLQFQESNVYQFSFNCFKWLTNDESLDIDFEDIIYSLDFLLESTSDEKLKLIQSINFFKKHSISFIDLLSIEDKINVDSIIKKFEEVIGKNSGGKTI